MATVQKFEDLICWQRSRELVREVYKALANCRDNGFRDQIQRAAVSVMSNIAEGFESGTKQEFLNYLYIAKASAGEVRAQTYVASDVGYIDISTFKHLNNLAEQCSRLIASFTAKLKTGGLAGEQRRPGRSREEVILEEIMEERGYVMTPQGVKKKTDI